MPTAGDLPDAVTWGRDVDQTWICSTDNRPASNYFWYLTKGEKSQLDCKSTPSKKQQSPPPSRSPLHHRWSGATFQLTQSAVVKPLREYLMITDRVSQTLFSSLRSTVFVSSWNCRVDISWCVFYKRVFVSASLPDSDAAGHNRVYLGAGLDHLSRHGGKRGADCQCAFQLLEHQTRRWKAAETHLQVSSFLCILEPDTASRGWVRQI